MDARPHRSAVVARPDKAQLVAMFEALRELEALCAGFAAERMTAKEHAGLQRIAAICCSTIVQSGDPQRYHEINEDFHARSMPARTMPISRELTLATRARIAPFSRAQFRNCGRLTKSHEEHERIIAAIPHRDPDGGLRPSCAATSARLRRLCRYRGLISAA